MNIKYNLPNALLMPNNEIEDGHRVLIGILNEAWKAVGPISKTYQDTDIYAIDVAPDGLAEAIRLLSGLPDAMKEHFQEEESVMQSLRYENFVQHQNLHNICLAETQGVITDITEGRLFPNAEVFNKLFDLIIDDVIKADSDFKSFLDYR